MLFCLSFTVAVGVFWALESVCAFLLCVVFMAKVGAGLKIKDRRSRAGGDLICTLVLIREPYNGDERLSVLPSIKLNRMF